MSVAIALLNIAVLAAISFLWWRKITSLRIVFWPALVIKLTSGILLGVLYSYYYTVGDTFSFFQDGVALSKLARNDLFSYMEFLWKGDESFPVWNDLIFRQPRSLFLTKLISVFNLVTANNYWITSLYFSFISFAACWVFITSINKYFPKASTAAVIAFLFFPSVIFWTSGIIKESLAMASLCFLSMIFIRLWVKDRIQWLEWLVGIWALWILWNLKYYFAAAFIPVVLTSYGVHNFLTPLMRSRKAWTEFMVWAIVFLIMLSIASFVHPNFYPERFLEVIVSNNNAFQQISQPDDIIRFNDLDATGMSVLYNAPLALVSGLFRPFIWESGNLFQFFVAMENAILVVLIVVSVRQVAGMMKSPDRLLVVSLVVYSTLLCIFITLSTPNFGTLSRYRIGYIPFFALLVMIDNPVIMRFEKFLKRFVQLKE